MIVVDASSFEAPPSPNAPTRRGLIDRLAPDHVLESVRSEAARSGVGMLDVLMVRRDVDQSAILQAIGASLGVGVITHPVDRGAGPSLSAESARAALRTGILVLADGRLLICARGYAMARAVALLRHDRAALARIVIAGPQVFCD